MEPLKLSQTSLKKYFRVIIGVPDTVNNYFPLGFHDFYYKRGYYTYEVYDCGQFGFPRVAVATYNNQASFVTFLADEDLLEEMCSESPSNNSIERNRVRESFLRKNLLRHGFYVNSFSY